jgi:hypothetical protein
MMKRFVLFTFVLVACEDVPTASRTGRADVVDVESLARDLQNDPLLREIANQLRVHEVALVGDSAATSDSTSSVPTEAEILQGVLDLSHQTVNALLRAR